jgi:salicylate hydroxylase
VTAGAPRIAVVGAGIGGLTLAAALAAAGTECEVFEQTRVLAEVGAGVQLAPNAVRPLHRLGLSAALREHAVRIDAVRVFGWHGEPIAVTPLGEACEQRFGAPYCAVHRADLHSALLAAVGPERVRLGRSLRRVDQHPDGVRLTFADGAHHDADLVVGADGIHSVVREAIRRDTPVFSGLGVFRGLVPAQQLSPGARQPVVRMWLGPGQHLVCYPVAGGRLVSFAATTPLAGKPSESWSATGDPDDLVRAFDGWAEPIAELVGAVGQIRRWALHDRDPLPGWSAGRITVLGDAAHPMLPFMAQGANQAIEDAVDLAACLAGARRDELPDRLAGYETSRLPRTAAIQRGSRGNANLLHLADGAAQQARDRAIRESAALSQRAWLYDYDAGRTHS